MAATRRRTSNEIGTPGLAHLIKRGWIDDSPEIQAAWGRYDAGRNTADFQLLVEHYSPKVLHETCRMKKRSRGFYRDSLDEMISDGLVGLMRYMRGIPAHAPMPSRIYWMHKAIRTAIANATMKRAKARRGMQSLDDQSPAEDSRPLNQLVTADRFMDGEFRNSGHREPDQPAMDAEVVRLVMRGMHPTDKKIVRRLMHGMYPAEISRAISLSRQRVDQRIRRIAQTLSQRDDVKKYLGLESVTPPPGKLHLKFKFENSPKTGETNGAYSRGQASARGLHQGMQAVQVPERSFIATTSE